MVLLGQTVNSYRHEEADFADLLRAVARVDGIERIRFTSPYPVDFTERVIAAHRRGAEGLQVRPPAGAVRLRRRARRACAAATRVGEYRDLVRPAARAVPGIALSTDILSGFSGETEADHAATLALMREVRFDCAFMFAYSERDLTYAARKLPDDVLAEVKKRRLREIVALQETISAEVNAAQVGRRERVLVHSRVAAQRRSAARPHRRLQGGHPPARRSARPATSSTS